MVHFRQNADRVAILKELDVVIIEHVQHWRRARGAEADGAAFASHADFRIIKVFTRFLTRRKSLLAARFSVRNLTVSRVDNPG